MSAVLKTDSMTRICELAEIAPDTGVCALVGGKQVAIFRIQDSVYAVSNNDPFSGANVLSHSITCCIKGQLCIASPIYKQHFCLTSGQCLEDDSITLDTWATDIIDGVVYAI